MGLFSTIGSFFGPWGTAIGAGVDAVADRKDAKSDANQANAYNQARTSDEYQRQREFAQMGIRWRVDDAKAAGLHPLAALGTQGASYSPTISTFQSPARDSFSGMGQNLIRAKVATKTEQERIMENAQIRNAQLQNDLLEAQIAALRQPSNPPMPDVVGPRVGIVETTPSRTVSPSRGAQHVEAAPATGFKDVRIGGGGTLRLPAPETAEVMEAMGPGMASVFTGLSAARDLVHGPGTPQTALPKGYTWKWSALKQAYVASKEKTPRRTPPRSAWTASGIARKRFSGGASSSY